MDAEFAAVVSGAVVPEGFEVMVWVHGDGGRARLLGRPLDGGVVASWLVGRGLRGDVFLPGCELLDADRTGGFGVVLRDGLRRLVRATNTFGWVDVRSGVVIAAPVDEGTGKPVFSAVGEPEGGYVDLPGAGGEAVPAPSPGRAFDAAADWRRLLDDSSRQLSPLSANRGPVAGWLSDEDLSDPGPLFDYGPSPAQITRLAVLGRVPVQVVRGGDCFYEALIRSAPERVAEFLGFDGDLLARDMRTNVMQLRARLLEVFRADYEADLGWYDVLGPPGTPVHRDRVGRLEHYLGTPGLWTEAEHSGAVRVDGAWDIGDALPQIVTRLMGLGVEIVTEDGALRTLWQADGDAAPARLVRVEHPEPHYLATVPAGEELLGYSLEQLVDISIEFDADPIWDESRTPLRDLVPRLDGSTGARRLRSELRVLAEAARDWEQALLQAPLSDGMAGGEAAEYALRAVAVLALAARQARALAHSFIESLRSFVDRPADWVMGGLIVPVERGVVELEGVRVRLSARAVDGVVRMVRRADLAVGQSVWEVFGHREASGGPPDRLAGGPVPDWSAVVSPRRLGVLTVVSAGDHATGWMAWDDGDLGEMFFAGDVQREVDESGRLDILGVPVMMPARLANGRVVLRRDQSDGRRALVFDPGRDWRLLGVLVVEKGSDGYEVEFRATRAEGLAAVFEGASGAVRAVAFDDDWVGLGPYRAKVEGISRRRPSSVPAGVGWELPDVWWRWQRRYQAAAVLVDRAADEVLAVADEVVREWTLKPTNTDEFRVAEADVSELVEVWSNPAGDGLTAWVRGPWDALHDGDSVRNIFAPPGTVLLIVHSAYGFVDVRIDTKAYRRVPEAGLLSLLQGLVADRRLVVHGCFAALGGADALTQRWAAALGVETVGPVSLVVEVKYTGDVYASDEINLAFSEWPPWPLPERGAHLSTPTGSVPVAMERDWFWNTVVPVDPMLDRLWGGRGVWLLPDTSVRNLTRFLRRPDGGAHHQDPDAVIDVFVRGVSGDVDQVMVEVEEHHAKVKKLAAVRGRHVASLVLTVRATRAVRLFSVAPDGEVVHDDAQAPPIGPVGTGVAVEIARRIDGWVEYSNALVDISGGTVQAVVPTGSGGRYWPGLLTHVVRVVSDSGGRVLHATRTGRDDHGLALLDPADERLPRLRQLPDEGVFPVFVLGTMTADGRLLAPAADGQGWFGLTPRQLAASLPDAGVVRIAPVDVPDARLGKFILALQGIRGVENPVLYTLGQTTVTGQQGVLRQGGDEPMWERFGPDDLAPSGARLWLIPSDSTPQSTVQDGFTAGTPAALWTAGVPEASLLAGLASTPGDRLYMALTGGATQAGHGRLPEQVPGGRILGYLHVRRDSDAAATVHTFVSLPGAASTVRGAAPDVPDRLFGQLLVHTFQIGSDTLALVSPAEAGGMAGSIPPAGSGVVAPVRYMAYLATRPTPTARIDLINGKAYEASFRELVTELERRDNPPDRPLELLLLPDPTTPARDVADARQVAQWHGQRVGSGRTRINVASNQSVGLFGRVIGQPATPRAGDQSRPYPASGTLYARGHFIPLSDPVDRQPDTVLIRYEETEDLVTVIDPDTNAVIAVGYWADDTTRSDRRAVNLGWYEVSVGSVTYRHRLSPRWGPLPIVDEITGPGRRRVLRHPISGVLLAAFELPGEASHRVRHGLVAPAGLQHDPSTRTLIVSDDGVLRVDTVHFHAPGAGPGTRVRVGYDHDLIYVFGLHDPGVLAVASRLRTVDLVEQERRRLYDEARATLDRTAPAQTTEAQVDEPRVITAGGHLYAWGMHADLPRPSDGADELRLTVRHDEHTGLVIAFDRSRKVVAALLPPEGLTVARRPISNSSLLEVTFRTTRHDILVPRAWGVTEVDYLTDARGHHLIRHPHSGDVIHEWDYDGLDGALDALSAGTLRLPAALLRPGASAEYNVSHARSVRVATIEISSIDAPPGTRVHAGQDGALVYVFDPSTRRVFNVGAPPRPLGPPPTRPDQVLTAAQTLLGTVAAGSPSSFEVDETRAVSRSGTVYLRGQFIHVAQHLPGGGERVDVVARYNRVTGLSTVFDPTDRVVLAVTIWPGPVTPQRCEVIAHQVHAVFAPDAFVGQRLDLALDPHPDIAAVRTAVVPPELASTRMADIVVDGDVLTVRDATTGELIESRLYRGLAAAQHDLANGRLTVPDGLDDDEHTRTTHTDASGHVDVHGMSIATLGAQPDRTVRVGVHTGLVYIYDRGSTYALGVGALSEDVGWDDEQDRVLTEALASLGHPVGPLEPARHVESSHSLPGDATLTAFGADIDLTGLPPDQASEVIARYDRRTHLVTVHTRPGGVVVGAAIASAEQDHHLPATPEPTTISDPTRPPIPQRILDQLAGERSTSSAINVDLIQATWGLLWVVAVAGLTAPQVAAFWRVAGARSKTPGPARGHLLILEKYRMAVRETRRDVIASGRNQVINIFSVGLPRGEGGWSPGEIAEVEKWVRWLPIVDREWALARFTGTDLPAGDPPVPAEELAALTAEGLSSAGVARLWGVVWRTGTVDVARPGDWLPTDSGITSAGAVKTVAAFHPLDMTVAVAVDARPTGQVVRPNVPARWPQKNREDVTAWVQIQDIRHAAGERAVAAGASMEKRTLAPIVSPDHGGGTNVTPHRRQLPAPHHRPGLLLGGFARAAGEVGLQPAALVHHHPAAGAVAQPLDHVAPPPPRGHRDADAGLGGAVAPGRGPAAHRADRRQAAAGRRGQSRPGGPLWPRGRDVGQRLQILRHLGLSSGARDVPCVFNEHQ